MNGKTATRHSTRLAVVLFYLAIQSLDVLTTYIGLRRGAAEANLLPRWLLDNHGEAAMYLFKAVLVLAVLLLVVRLQHHYPNLWTALRVTNVMMVVVVAINLLAVV